MAILNVYKVTQLPDPVSTSSIYFIKSATDTELTICITDKLGLITYSTVSQSNVDTSVTAGINNRIGQANGIAGLDSSGNLLNTVMSVIDGQNSSLQSNNDYIWRDEISTFVVKAASSVNNPTFGSYFGNLQGYLFSKSTMQQVWCDFHMNHDIALNTKVYPHIYWLPITNNAGTVRWT
jgi:hypothetical protein